MVLRYFPGHGHNNNNFVIQEDSSSEEEHVSSDSEISYDEDRQYDYNQLTSLRDERKVSSQVVSYNIREEKVLPKIADFLTVTAKNFKSDMNLKYLKKEWTIITSDGFEAMRVTDNQMLAKECPYILENDLRATLPDFLKSMDIKEIDFDFVREDGLRRGRAKITTNVWFNGKEVGIDPKTKTVFSTTGALLTTAGKGFLDSKILRSAKKAAQERGWLKTIQISAMSALGITTSTIVGLFAFGAFTQNARKGARDICFNKEYARLETHNRRLRLEDKIERIEKELLREDISDEVRMILIRVRDYFEDTSKMVLLHQEYLDEVAAEKEHNSEVMGNARLHRF